MLCKEDPHSERHKQGPSGGGGRGVGLGAKSTLFKK